MTPPPPPVDPGALTAAVREVLDAPLGPPPVAGLDAVYRLVTGQPARDEAALERLERALAAAYQMGACRPGAK